MTAPRAPSDSPASDPRTNFEQHAAELRETLRTELPVTQHLGVVVESGRDGHLLLRAPLGANINHKGHAFAGSLNAIATLAGWSWVWLLLRGERLDGHVVIQDSSISYDRPVATDFLAECVPPAHEAAERFLAVLRRRRRGRIALHVTVSDQQGPAVRFTGRYVAHLAAAPSSSASNAPHPD
jgi:thioesterase domain-containing protein